MKLTPTVERLRSEGCQNVSGALELAGLQAPPQLPAHFVVPQGENAAPNTRQGVHHQEVETTIGVVVMVRGVARREELVSEELGELLDKAIDAVIGWAHPEAAEAFSYSGGRLLSVSGQTLSWLLTFTTKRQIRKALS
jgi:hypothetical protein